VHTIALDPAVLARVQAWRGSAHPFADLDPATTAHVVVDMQQAFTLPGAELEVPEARGIVAPINDVVRAVRDAGGLNVFVQMTVDEGTPANWSTWLRYFCDASRADGTIALLSEGSVGHRLDPGLDVGEGDVVVPKSRYSPFVTGSSPLHELLAERGIDTLIISGTVTNCCCESTARDAMQLNYKVVFLSNATAALSDADHNATLNNMVSIFADVMTSSEVVDILRR
jgi:ureidoacrylate peracid hydrolase